VPEVGLERRQAIDNTQVIDFKKVTIATISWFGGKLVRIEYTVGRQVPQILPRLPATFISKRNRRTNQVDW
jgi:hypothetical protein